MNKDQCPRPGHSPARTNQLPVCEPTNGRERSSISHTSCFGRANGSPCRREPILAAAAPSALDEQAWAARRSDLCAFQGQWRRTERTDAVGERGRGTIAGGAAMGMKLQAPGSVRRKAFGSLRPWETFPIGHTAAPRCCHWLVPLLASVSRIFPEQDVARTWSCEAFGEPKYPHLHRALEPRRPAAVATRPHAPSPASTTPRPRLRSRSLCGSPKVPARRLARSLDMRNFKHGPGTRPSEMRPLTDQTPIKRARGQAPGAHWLTTPAA